MIEILKETARYLVCVKPIGTAAQGTQQEAMPQLLSAQLGCGIFPVHRLDQTVGGVMVYAKTAQEAARLTQAMGQGQMQKTYLAVLTGCPAERAGTLEDLLFHDRAKNKTYVVRRPRGGVKQARLHYEILAKQDGLSLARIRLETGRTHQIRVHMAWQGHPLFNDERYGGDRILKGTTFSKYKQFIENCFAVMPRHALHAQSLGFVHPMTHEAVYFESELPDDFRALLEKWDTYAAASKESNNG